MKCRHVRENLSALYDGDLSAGETQALNAHLQGCDACALRFRTLRESLAALRALPRVRPAERIAREVLDRIEVQSRGPSLALLFRPAWAARPLIFPALLPAALVLVTILAGVFAMQQEPSWRGTTAPRQAATWETVLPPSGTEGNPLLLSSDVTVPRLRVESDWHERALSELSEDDTLFLETIVARDGSISDVRVIEGDAEQALAITQALSHERYEPGRYRGRPVAVSLYRLISSVEVRVPRT
ncbi:MAG: zf-HC2 domain-containing protein [Vicinamibacteria bacterium]|jgi:hypothetical protein|nr:zf-HC2 domain-containing protein [Vicinamibacteria bacterium]